MIDSKFATCVRCLTIQPVTGPSAEVMNALVRLMSGETDYGELSDDELVTILAIHAAGRMSQYRAATELNDRGKTFAQMAELVKAKLAKAENADAAVHEATLARWAKRPDPDRRRRRPRGDAGE